MKKKILIVFGTRPEAIKFIPLIRKIHDSNYFELKVCITSQHKEMLKQIIHFFDISFDFDLDVMTTNQDLSSLTSLILKGVTDVLNQFNPDLIIVQGDTTTAFASSLAAFYKKIPVAHLEAGLRSFNNISPFPEEINRKLISSIAEVHFAPTLVTQNNLNLENVFNNVYVTGNTVVDSLFLTLSMIDKMEDQILLDFNYLDFSKRIILITGHRRESFGQGFENICNALISLAEMNPNIQIVYPVHLNPNVQNIVRNKLTNSRNIFLINPLEYHQLIFLLKKSYFVMTDSGGIQEEAPSLGKPVLIMRDVTERVEGINSGNSKLVGTDTDAIIKNFNDLLVNNELYNSMSNAKNPYGDGNASDKILEVLKKLYL